MGTRSLDFLLRGVGGALSLVHRVLRRRHVARRGGGGDRRVALRGRRHAFGVRQLGARFLHRDLVVARIDLDQHRSRFDRLVVREGDVQNRARDLRGDLGHARINLRIVGRLAAASEPEPQAGCQGHQEHRAGDCQDPSRAHEPHPVRLIGHQRTPPRNCRTASSAPPSAATIRPFAEL